MDDLVIEYIKYIASISNIKRPKMPKFETTAYSDSEYNLAIQNVMSDFENIDDFYLTIKHLQGE